MNFRSLLSIAAITATIFQPTVANRLRVNSCQSISEEQYESPILNDKKNLINFAFNQNGISRAISNENYPMIDAMCNAGILNDVSPERLKPLIPLMPLSTKQCIQRTLSHSIQQITNSTLQINHLIKSGVNPNRLVIDYNKFTESQRRDLFGHPEPNSFDEITICDLENANEILDQIIEQINNEKFNDSNEGKLLVQLKIKTTKDLTIIKNHLEYFKERNQLNSSEKRIYEIIENFLEYGKPLEGILNSQGSENGVTLFR